MYSTTYWESFNTNNIFFYHFFCIFAHRITLNISIMTKPYDGPSYEGLSTGFTLDPIKESPKSHSRNEETTVTTVNAPKPSVSPRGNA